MLSAMADETSIDVAGRSIRLTSPGKILFPVEGWTKMHVVEHYLGCGEAALHAVQDRPCLLKRWPDGVTGKPFFQKRPSKNYAGDTVLVRFPAATSGRMMVARTLADVIGWVQLGCIDLNPWPVRASS